MATKDTSKQWFETDDFPTQAQFYQVFDWLRWKDEKIDITDVNGLQTILNGIATITAIKALFRMELTVDADFYTIINDGVVITGFVLISNSNTLIKCGLSAGADDLISAEVQAGVPVSISTIFYAAGTTEIYFSGITSQTKIIILTNPKK